MWQVTRDDWQRYGDDRVQRLQRPDGNTVAYATTSGRAPTVAFLGGFRSDMTGTKAMALEEWARRTGRAYCASTISATASRRAASRTARSAAGSTIRWPRIDQLTDGKLVLVGSSMGGWLSLLVARARPERLAGLVLIAAAPDFTERMLLNGLSPEDRAKLQRDGRLERPSQYSPEPSVFTWKLIEEGRNHLVLDKKLALPCPVRLLHGQSDPDVPWEYSLQIANHLEAPEVITTLIKGGDHRLSTPADIARLIETIEELL